MSSLLTSQTSAYLLHRTWHHSAHKAAFTDHAIRAFAKFTLCNSTKQRRWCLLTPSKQLCIHKYTSACVKRARYYTASTPPMTKFPWGDNTSVMTIEQWHCSTVCTTKINFRFSQVREKDPWRDIATVCVYWIECQLKYECHTNNVWAQPETDGSWYCFNLIKLNHTLKCYLPQKISLIQICLSYFCPSLTESERV